MVRSLYISTGGDVGSIPGLGTKMRWWLCSASSSHVRLSVTPWIVAQQAPLSIGSSRQEYWNGLSFPIPGDLLHPGIEPVSLMSLALAGGFFTTSATWEAEDGGGGDNKTKNVNMSVYNCPV